MHLKCSSILKKLSTTLWHITVARPFIVWVDVCCYSTRRQTDRAGCLVRRHVKEAKKAEEGCYILGEEERKNYNTTIWLYIPV
jgi:hypothetical protein